MGEHPIQGLMTTAMENLKDMIEVNTIIGDPVESPDGSIIVPVSKVGFGFAAGGSEFSSGGGGSKGDSSSGDSKKLPFGGGSGGGVSITPVAFLIVNQKGIKMIHMDENVHLYEKMINFAPQAVEKIQQILKESNQSKQQNKDGKQKQDKQDNQNSKEKNNQDNQDKQDESQQSNYDI